MALIGKIRKHMWVVVAGIALALIGFILQDMTSGQQSIFGSQQNIVGKVNGKRLDNREFGQNESIVQNFLYRGADQLAIRDLLWNQFVEETIVKEEAEALGLGVCKEELLELQFGENLSPLIRQRFTNQQTQQLEREQLGVLKKQIEDNTMDPNFKVFWRYQEFEVIKERLQSKLGQMVAKGLYSPTWMTEMLMKEQNDRIDFAFVRVPFDDVENSEVSLSDADFKAYFDENKYKYRRDEETRAIEYLQFDVTLSAKDSADIKKLVSDRLTAFAETTDDSTFVETNLGVYEDKFVSKEALSASVADTLFKVAIGTVVGPYLDGEEYRAAKLLGKKVVADSADTRHILIPGDPKDPASFAAVEKTIDSLKILIETGAARFDSLASKMSKDPGSAQKGGKYENVTQGQFVAEYDKVIFETGEIGKLYKIRTSFGWHLVEVLKRKGGNERLKVAYLVQRLIPSEESQKTIYNEVYQLVQNTRNLEELKKVAEAKKLSLKISPYIKRTEYAIGELGSGASSRQITKWAFGDDIRLGKPDVGGVSPDIYTFRDASNAYDNRYVLAGLKAVVPKGYPKWQDIRADLEPDVINRKKADILKSKINSQDLAALASTFNTKVDTARSISFFGAVIPNAGPEPKVIATAFKLDNGAVSEPLTGTAGVYILKILNKQEAQNVPVDDIMGNQFVGAVRQQVTSRLVETMKKGADISDNRANFW